MRKTPKEIEESIFEQWLAGESYRQIARKHDIEIGTISRIIGDYRKKTPNLDQIRKLYTKLKKAGLTTFDVI